MEPVEADIRDEATAREVLQVQLESYAVESRLIEYPDFPPLRQTARDLQDSGERFFVSRIGGAVAGAISVAAVNGTADICRLVVSPAHMGKGIGTVLVRAVEAAYPASRITVSTAWKNTPAVRLYLKLGYRILRRPFLPDGLELVEFEKQL
jgi:ribosomal protein S18 acetylase RimI-like enzyme